MQFSLTQEQEDLRQFVRDFLAQHAGDQQLHRISRDGYSFDRATWSTMAGQLGIQGLVVPEELGGSGATTLEAAIVLEEMGRALYAGPFLSTFLGTQVLRAAAPEVRQQVLPGVADGSTILTVAVADAGASWSTPGSATKAVPTADGYVISGEKRYVTDAGTATILLVWAHTPDGPGWFMVEQGTPGLEPLVSEGLDLTREIGHVHLSRTPATLVVPPAAADATLRHLLDTAAVALAAEMVGGAGACLDQAVAWSKDRLQFGRPIGSFQAVKHACANTLVELETARMLAQYAAYANSAGAHDASVVASMAKQAAADAYYQAAGTNIQIHGGIGFTWEHRAHLFLRRAKADAALFDDSIHHRARVADLLSF
jgi:alkylation response protein AidB-like acyl-CoA dehydrogenase